MKQALSGFSWKAQVTRQRLSLRLLAFKRTRATEVPKFIGHIAHTCLLIMSAQRRCKINPTWGHNVAPA